MVRLDDVAKRAGISKNTASRVLNNRGYISEETRAKVRQAMEELNYQPNETARNLLKGRSGLIGLLLPIISGPYYYEIIDTAERELAKRNYKMLLCNFAHSGDTERKYLQMLQRNRIDGLIISDHELDASDYANLEFPIVSLDRYVGPGVSYIRPNHEQGGRLAAETLIRCGCKEVLQIAGLKEKNSTWNARHAIFEEIMLTSGIKCNTHRTDAYSAENLEAHRKIVRVLIEQYPNCDGFFGNDMFACAILQETIKRGLAVPDDFKIVGYDGTMIAELTTPAITTIRTHPEKIALAGVDILCKMIADDSLGSFDIQFDVELIERRSTQMILRKPRAQAEAALI